MASEFGHLPIRQMFENLIVFQSIILRIKKLDFKPYTALRFAYKYYLQKFIGLL